VGHRCQKCRALLRLEELSHVREGVEVDEALLVKGILRLQDELNKGPSPTAHVELATIYLNLNQSSRAVIHLQEALDLVPEDLRLQARLRSLRSRRVVLVVDRSVAVKRTVAEILEPYLLRVTYAAGGLQAISQIEQDMPDLILLSGKLPDVKGYQLRRFLKKNACTKGLPVIRLVDTDGLIGKLRGRLPGITDSIREPLQPEPLLRTLKKYLPHSHLPDSGPSGEATLKI
jgi:CheY-like chemotaxis protein